MLVPKKNWIEEQELSGISFKDTIEGFKRAVVSCLGETANNIMIHCINSLPTNQKDITVANSTRNTLLSSAIRTTGIDVKEIKFVKPLPILEEQEKELIRLNAVAEGITKGMVVAHGKHDSIINTISQQWKELNQKKEKLEEKMKQLEEKDCDKNISIYTQNLNSEWGWFPWQWLPAVKIDETLPYEIIQVIVSQGYWKSTADSQFQLRGTIYNSLFKSLSTTITAFAKYRVYYAKVIKELKDEIEKLIEVIEDKKKESENFLKEQAKTSELIGNYEIEMSSLERKKEELRSEYFTEQELLQILPGY